MLTTTLVITFNCVCACVSVIMSSTETLQSKRSKIADDQDSNPPSSAPPSQTPYKPPNSPGGSVCPAERYLCYCAFLFCASVVGFVFICLHYTLLFTMSFSSLCIKLSILVHFCLFFIFSENTQNFHSDFISLCIVYFILYFSCLPSLLYVLLPISFLPFHS